MPKKLGFKDFIAVDYTQTGDDQLALNSKKRKKDIPTGNNSEEVELQAALNIQQRLKKARQMKKLAPKIAIGRARAARKIANMDTLKKRAKKQARNMLAKKLTKGVGKADLNMARRMEIEKRLDKMKPKIDKLAKKLLPKVRKQELARKRGKSEES
jgi:thiamine kinase-like enzyme